VPPAENVWTAPAPAGHADRIRGLWRSWRDERLPHALLFSGPRGVGKFTAARWFVRGLFCARLDPERGPCGTCPPCKRLAAGSHPDLFVVEPDLSASEYLRIHHFVPREGEGPNAEEFLRLRPVEGGWRVVLVREMERCERQVQNTLLKMLEEPGDSVLWLLETSKPSALLPTIRSRCVRVDFSGLGCDEARDVLAGRGLPPAAAATLARWSGGAPGEALGLHARGALEARDLLRDLLAGRARAFGGEPAARRLWELAGAFQGRTQKGVERDRARFVLDLALAVVRDLQRLDAGVAPEVLAHGDLAADLAPLGLARGRRVVDALLEARRDVDRNVDPVAVMDLALLALERPEGRPAAAAGGAR